MTLDEAIEHAREVADNTECSECADEHLQLAEWLEELKWLRFERKAFLQLQMKGTK